MEIRKVWALYYSATGVTEKTVAFIAGELAEKLDVPMERISFTVPAQREREYHFTPEDLVPVYLRKTQAEREREERLALAQNGE